MNIALGADHAGFPLAIEIKEYLIKNNYTVEQFGATSEEPYHYPKASDEVVSAILNNSADRGIIVCGSGIGVCIRANRYQGIRAAECKTAEQAKLARDHNHLNVLCLAGRILSIDEAIPVVEAFLKGVEGDQERLVTRVKMLDAPTG